MTSSPSGCGNVTASPRNECQKCPKCLEAELRQIDNSSVIGMVSVKGEEVKDEHSEHAYAYTAATKEELNDALIIRAKRTRVFQ